MKNLTYLMLLLTFFTACGKEYIYQNPISGQYQEALDTLVNYDNYFIGEFNGELLVSVEPFSYGGSVGNTLKDSVSVNFMYSYKIANSKDLKTPFLYFTVYESINKFDSFNNYRYSDYNDFYTFFNRSEFEYFQLDKFKNLTPEIIIKHVDYTQLINNTGIEYNSADWNKPPFNDNNFYVESIREIESPYKGIQLTYSFNCTLFSDFNELIEIKNGKGRCYFKY